jgi:hypothetical protein
VLHVSPCVCHVSPTFSYRPKIDKIATLAKTGSDNIGIFVLYGTTIDRCQGGEFGEWYREEGLSEPLRFLYRFGEMLKNTHDLIREYLDRKIPVSVIARLLGVNRLTVRNYIRTRKLEKSAP